MRAQKTGLRAGARQIGKIKSVHVVARGMVLGDVERLEIVVSGFNFRTFDDRKTNRSEDAIQLFVSLADEMLRAERTRDSGKREIEAVARGCCFERGGFSDPF